MNIVVTLPVDKAHREKFEAMMPEAQFTYTDKKNVTQAQVAEAEIILGNLPAALLPGAKKLKWLQLNSAGAENYTKPAYCRQE